MNLASSYLPIKVLHIAPTPFFSDRGCHIRIQGVVNAIKNYNADSVVCTYHHGREMPGVRTERISSIRGYENTKAGPDSFKYLADMKLLLLAGRLMARERPDVIHAHLHEGVLVGWLVKMLFFWRRVPLFADIQGGLVGELDSFAYFAGREWLRKVFKGMEYLILRMPSRLMCSSVVALETSRDKYKVPQSRLELLADRIDVGAFEKVTAVARKDIDIPENNIVLVYSGSLLPSKGLPELHQVMHTLLQRRDDIHFLIIGYPTDETEYFLTKSKLRSRCSVIGRVPYEELPAYLKIADIGIDPKAGDAGEGSGKIVNYMAAKLPVVCFDTENNRQLLGESSKFIKQGDIDSAAGYIELLADDAVMRRKLGETNRARAEQHLSWDSAGRIIRSLYDQALDQRKSAAI